MTLAILQLIKAYAAFCDELLCSQLVSNYARNHISRWHSLQLVSTHQSRNDSDFCQSQQPVSYWISLQSVSSACFLLIQPPISLSSQFRTDSASNQSQQQVLQWFSQQSVSAASFPLNHSPIIFSSPFVSKQSQQLVSQWFSLEPISAKTIAGFYFSPGHKSLTWCWMSFPIIFPESLYFSYLTQNWSCEWLASRFSWHLVTYCVGRWKMTL